MHIIANSLQLQLISHCEMQKLFICVHLHVSYYNKIKLTDNQFVYYPYEKIIDSKFILKDSKNLKSTNYFYRITTNILEKQN